VSSVCILVADDFPEWRVEARNLLRVRPDWEVTEASDGREAVQKAAELRPDIVLLDIGMPILNGLEAAKKIRETTPGSKLIFLTLNGDNEVKTAALTIGAKAYLSKSQAQSQLLSTIADALDAH